MLANRSVVVLLCLLAARPLVADDAPGEIERRTLIGTWVGGGFFAYALELRHDGTYTSTSLVDGQAESGDWSLVGRALRRRITSAPDEQRVGLDLDRSIVRLEPGLLQLGDERGNRWGYHPAHVYRGMHLLELYAQSENVDALFEPEAEGSPRLRLRPTVRILHADAAGVVYQLPETERYYVQSDPPGSTRRTYYGAYEGDPRTALDLEDEDAR